MNQINETELKNRIATFMSQKEEEFPELETNPRLFWLEDESDEPTLLEKINSFWTQWIHA